MQGILSFLVSRVAKTDSPMMGMFWKWLLHALGDKTCTLIGSVLSWVPAVAIDTTKLPPNYAATVNAIFYGLGILGTVFAGYVTRPSVGHAIATAVNTDSNS